jgi:hypothetical protein
MFDILRAQHVRENEDVEGFEHRFDQPRYSSILNADIIPGEDIAYPGGPMNKFADNYFTIGGNGVKTVSFKPLSGLLSCGKLLPIRYCPITIELELCSDMNDPIISVDSITCNLRSTPHEGDSSVINNSTSWVIENPCVKVDICVLDNALNNEYAALLLSGKALPINYSSYVSQLQSISGQNPSVNITRALSRLKSVFVTLDQAIPDNESKEIGSDRHIRIWKKWWNDFFSSDELFTSSL